MIIFYDKITGKIEGTIDGRVHTEDHLKMWVGDPDKTDRLIVNWKAVKFYDAEGGEVAENDPKKFTADFEPEHEQKELFIDIDQRKSRINDYKVDIQTKLLIFIE